MYQIDVLKFMEACDQIKCAGHEKKQLAELYMDLITEEYQETLEAFKILMSSIIIGSRWVTEKEMAFSSMMGFNFSLVLSDNCLESCIKLSSKLLGNKMAAAVTGPAKQPLPASSVPHSNIKLL